MAIAGIRPRRERRVGRPTGGFGLNYRDPAETPISPYFQAVMANAPAAYWRLNETGSGPFKDSANPGLATHNATPNATIVTGSSRLPLDTDAAATLDHAGAFFTAVTTFTFNSLPMSIEFWVTPTTLTSLGGVQSYIVSNGGTGGGWAVGYKDTTGTWRTARNGLAFQDFTAAIAAGETQYVVAVFNSDSSVDLYINGAFQQKIAGAGGLGGTTDPVRIGGQGATAFPKAVIDEVAIYSAALTYAQIRAHWDASLYGRYGAADSRVVHRVWAGRS